MQKIILMQTFQVFKLDFIIKTECSALHSCFGARTGVVRPPSLVALRGKSGEFHQRQHLD